MKITPVRAYSDGVKSYNSDLLDNLFNLDYIFIPFERFSSLVYNP